MANGAAASKLEGIQASEERGLEGPQEGFCQGCLGAELSAHQQLPQITPLTARRIGVSLMLCSPGSFSMVQSYALQEPLAHEAIEVNSNTIYWKSRSLVPEATSQVLRSHRQLTIPLLDVWTQSFVIITESSI